MNDDNIIEQIRKNLIEAVGAYPEDTDDADKLRYVASSLDADRFVTEVRYVQADSSLYGIIQVWYTDTSEPFLKVAEFSYILEVEAICSFVQQFAML
jgi:3'-phosphoadenosine 5'-phosphosulfate sulfotransferase (PAPS reductase)/FAD synthetase